MQQPMNQNKQCPKCKEDIKSDALVCKYCGNKFDFGSKMVSLGNSLTGLGCALTFIVIVVIILFGLL